MRLAVNAEGCLRSGVAADFFLSAPRTWVFRYVRGIETSRDAVTQAKLSLRRHIIDDVMRPGIFKAGEFDAICMFHIFDHIPHPNELLSECLRILKPGGFILSLNHNVEVRSARLLGERSPIFDIQFTFLYSPRTMRLIFEANRFEVIEQGRVWNTYSLTYLFDLTPLPRVLKRDRSACIESLGVRKPSAHIAAG